MSNTAKLVPGFKALFSTESLDCGVECHVVNFDADTVSIEVYWTGGAAPDSIIEVNPDEFVTRSFARAAKVLIRSDRGGDKLFNYRVSFFNKRIQDDESRHFHGVIHSGGSELKSSATTSCHDGMDVQVKNSRPSNVESNYQVSGTASQYSLSVTYSDA